jgi:hypothetical protein
MIVSTYTGDCLYGSDFSYSGDHVFLLFSAEHLTVLENKSFSLQSLRVRSFLVTTFYQW